MSNRAFTQAYPSAPPFPPPMRRGSSPEKSSGGGNASAKAPRALIARLKVVTEICPQVFPRILDLIAQRGIVPLSINYEQRRTRLHVQIEIEAVPEDAAAILAAKIAGFVRVRSVGWGRPRRR